MTSSRLCCRSGGLPEQKFRTPRSMWETSKFMFRHLGRSQPYKPRHPPAPDVRKEHPSWNLPGHHLHWQKAHVNDLQVFLPPKIPCWSRDSKTTHFVGAAELHLLACGHRLNVATVRLEDNTVACIANSAHRHQRAMHVSHLQLEYTTLT